MEEVKEQIELLVINITVYMGNIIFFRKISKLEEEYNKTVNVFYGPYPILLQDWQINEWFIQKINDQFPCVYFWDKKKIKVPKVLKSFYPN